MKFGGRQKVVSLTEMEDRVWNLGLPEGLEIEGENPRTERYTERRAPPNVCANTPQFLGSSHWIKKKYYPIICCLQETHLKDANGLKEKNEKI